MCYVPSLATDKVAAVLPVDTVVAVVAVPVVDGAAVVGPEGVVVAAVPASAAGGAPAGHEELRHILATGVSLGELGGVEGEGEGAGGAEEESLEGDHVCGGLGLFSLLRVLDAGGGEGRSEDWTG